jgi:CheY-like chemotaxis protein
MSSEISKDLFKNWVIVVVDDEEDSLMVAEIILIEYGAQVHTASHGQEALDLIRQVGPRFVISDLSMPIMDGWGLIHGMKTDPALANIPVIALTAHAMPGDRERAIAAGFHNYLTKPLSATTFLLDLVNLLTEIPSLSSDLELPA